VKRRPSRAPGAVRSVGRWFHVILIGGLVVALAACGQATSTGQPTNTGQPSEAASSPAETPSSGSSIEPPIDNPTASTTPEPSLPESQATPPPAATPGTGTGSAASCSGSDENRDFFASMAAAVDWTVYCPVLADGWFVDDGRYRLAGGGWLEISYDGPGDTRLILQQGGFCSSDDGCVPAGRSVGPVEFGDRTGSLIASDDGTWSVIVNRGANPSWLLVVNGLDEAAVRTIAADLHAVEG
jgi:hypothetical protein